MVSLELVLHSRQLHKSVSLRPTPPPRQASHCVTPAGKTIPAQAQSSIPCPLPKAPRPAQDLGGAWGVARAPRLTCPQFCRPPRRTAGGGGRGCPPTSPSSRGR